MARWPAEIPSRPRCFGDPGPVRSCRGNRTRLARWRARRTRRTVRTVVDEASPGPGADGKQEVPGHAVAAVARFVQALDRLVQGDIRVVPAAQRLQGPPGGDHTPRVLQHERLEG